LSEIAPVSKWEKFKGVFSKKKGEKKKGSKKIGEFAATAICGNDISSSVFYVAGKPGRFPLTRRNYCFL
jgi:hypothetical protein